jgi:hypothetical protein
MTTNTVKQSKLNLNKKDILNIMKINPRFLDLVYKLAKEMGYTKTQTLSNQVSSEKQTFIL